MDNKKSVAGDSKWQANVDQQQWRSYEIYTASMSNDGLHLNDTPLNAQFKIIRKAWPADDFPFKQDAVPVSLKTKGKIIPE